MEEVKGLDTNLTEERIVTLISKEDGGRVPVEWSVAVGKDGENYHSGLLNGALENDEKCTEVELPLTAFEMKTIVEYITARNRMIRKKLPTVPLQCNDWKEEFEEFDIQFFEKFTFDELKQLAVAGMYMNAINFYEICCATFSMRIRPDCFARDIETIQAKLGNSPLPTEDELKEAEKLFDQLFPPESLKVK